jgi:hypothetical protein
MVLKTLRLLEMKETILPSEQPSFFHSHPNEFYEDA